MSGTGVSQPHGSAAIRDGTSLLKRIVLGAGVVTFFVLALSPLVHLPRLLTRWVLALVGAGFVYLLYVIATHVVAVGIADWLNNKKVPYWLVPLTVLWFVVKPPETAGHSLPSLANVDSSTVRATA